MESVYRVDLKRADLDPGLLDGDDAGGEGTATCVGLTHYGKGCQKAVQHGLNVKRPVRSGVQQDRHEDRLRLAIGEWHGPVLRPVPRTQRR